MGGLKTAWSMTRQTFDEWSNDKGGRLGAALSYYTVFALAPLLLIVISVSAQIVLLGAEFTRVYANRFGAKVRPSEEAVPAQIAAPRPPPPDARPREA